MSPVETMSLVKYFSILEIALFFFGLVVVAMVIVINSVIGGFSRVDLVWLAASTFRLQVSDYSQLSDYNCTEWFVKNEAADAPITFEDIVIVMIYWGTVTDKTPNMIWNSLRGSLIISTWGCTFLRPQED